MSDFGFGSADFNIVPNGDLIPMPVKDEQGFSRYTATVMLPSRTQLNVLLSYQSQYEILPALGGGGTIVITSGASHTLIYPMQNNVEGEVGAILISCAPQVRFLESAHIVADCVWVLTE